MSTASRRRVAREPIVSGPAPSLRVIVPPIDAAGDDAAGDDAAGGNDGPSDGGRPVDPHSEEEAGGDRRAGRIDRPEDPDPVDLEELAEASRLLERSTPREILQWAADRYAPHFTMATAFGPEGMTLIHLLAEVAPDTRIFNLDTGYQFPETLELRERVLQRYGIAVRLVRPEMSVKEYEEKNGGPVHAHDPDRCCWERKISLLRGSIVGMKAWASAIRRDQSPDRANAPIIGWDKKFGLVKVSPLANWTKKDVWKLITDHDIPYNPLHDRGYPSVGCQPCTRAVLFGEDERAGRWSGTAKTECGLHSLED